MSLSVVFFVLAILLSNIMCAVVAYNYCDMLWGIKYAGYSAPAWTAFLSGIPFLIGIIVCVCLALYFRKKNRK
ncbi:MAG: hypothetical protein J6Z03_05685, partial [Erysipelotrichaceae bacterium]|nr:hypothetical protein [Erysipelotrichaceae bacterium]